MEALISMPAVDFNFDSGYSTPYMSAPSSPKPFGKFYYSAPTSPTRSSALYRDFNNISFVQRNRNRSTSYDDDNDSQFNWDVEIDENINSKDTHFDHQEEFAFDFSGQLEKTALTADELFDGGKIRAASNMNSSVSSPKSPKKNSKRHEEEEEEEERGRERGSVFTTSRSKHRSTRSLSPLRSSEFLIEDQEQSIEPNSSCAISKSFSFSFFTKWRLRDFLLFRSASEGRATGRDPLKKYTSSMSRKHEQQRNSSFRSTDGSGSMRKGSGSGSGHHKLYYTSNREVQDELKRKTYLPYRNGLLGCVGFNPTIDGLAKGLNSFRRG